MITHINYSLKKLNTFGVEAKAALLYELYTLEDVKEAILKTKNLNPFILNGGSNILILNDLTRPVLKINLLGKEILKETETQVIVRAMAGENWHNLVVWALNHNYGGLENLALIPGNCGAAPIQNIGAYGVELKDVFVGCSVIHLKDGRTHYFTKDDCNFGYRSSIFKTTQKNQWVIISIDLQLSKFPHPITTAYGAIQGVLAQKRILHPTIQEVAKAVIQIRESKLPNPSLIGNGGSFFKNPMVSKVILSQLQNKYPDIPFYEISEDEVKIPAGWLIEQSGLKGYQVGNVGVHDKQALVLVNHGGGSGLEIQNLCNYVQEKVSKKFKILLEPEINMVF